MIDDRACQVQVINSHRLMGCSVLGADTEGAPHVMTDLHWRDMIRESQEDMK